MLEKIVLSGLTINVVKKDIKNLHLSVYPPQGYIRISAPLRMHNEHIRLFAISKLYWIKQQQKKFQQQPRQQQREYLNRESHYLWGKRYLLKVIERDASPAVELKHKQIYLYIRPNQSNKAHLLVEYWYRQQFKQAIVKIMSKWESIIGVTVKKFFIQKMKTKWGSCNPDNGNVRFNIELAKKPIEYLEYIVVHEMLHLLEPTHNKRFIALMDKFMPIWQFYKNELNFSLLKHEQWKY